MRAGLALACAAWLCGCSPAAPQKTDTPPAAPAVEAAAPARSTAPAPAAAPFRLDFDGYGPVRIGMSIAEAERATGRTFTHVRYNDGPEGCDLLWVEGDGPYEPLLFMAQNGRITRISAGARDDRPTSIETVQGIGIGSDAAAVRRVFGGQLRQEAAPYVGPPSYDLYVWRTPERGMRFAINPEGRVEDIYVGARSIQYVEDCL